MNLMIMCCFTVKNKQIDFSASQIKQSSAKITVAPKRSFKDPFEKQHKNKIKKELTKIKMDSSLKNKFRTE